MRFPVSGPTRNYITVERWSDDVGDESKADLTAPKSDFRFTSESRHRQLRRACPKSAMNGLSRSNNREVDQAQTARYRLLQRYAAYAFTQRRIVAKSPIGPALSENAVAVPTIPSRSKSGSMSLGRSIDAG
jgi:hypothetical protein